MEECVSAATVHFINPLEHYVHMCLLHLHVSRSVALTMVEQRGHSIVFYSRFTTF